jgi:hypothetical protein
MSAPSSALPPGPGGAAAPKPPGRFSQAGVTAKAALAKDLKGVAAKMLATTPAEPGTAPAAPAVPGAAPGGTPRAAGRQPVCSFKFDPVMEVRDDDLDVTAVRRYFGAILEFAKASAILKASSEGKPYPIYLPPPTPPPAPKDPPTMQADVAAAAEALKTAGETLNSRISSVNGLAVRLGTGAAQIVASLRVLCDEDPSDSSKSVGIFNGDKVTAILKDNTGLLTLLTPLALGHPQPPSRGGGRKKDSEKIRRDDPEGLMEGGAKRKGSNKVSSKKVSSKKVGLKKSSKKTSKRTSMKGGAKRKVSKKASTKKASTKKVSTKKVSKKTSKRNSMKGGAKRKVSKKASKKASKKTSTKKSSKKASMKGGAKSRASKKASSKKASKKASSKKGSKKGSMKGGAKSRVSKKAGSKASSKKVSKKSSKGRTTKK